MKQRYLAYCLIYLALCFSLSCDKTEISTDKRYTGRLLVRDCPSYAVVDVTNANIDQEWRFDGKVYKNVIGIWNMPDDIAIGNNISFYIDLSTDRKSFQAEKFCLAIIGIEPLKQSYCCRDIQRTD